MEPLYSGTYPAVMVNRVGGRLPKFTKREYLMVKGSYDFIGLNYYTSTYATSSPCPRERPTAFTDACVRFTSKSFYVKLLHTFLLTSIEFSSFTCLPTIHFVALASAVRNGLLIGPKVLV